ncbi:hypothetical protein LGH70_16930 [Hymenobacter sp. BT635]|uniref:DUF4177 domain-containing protein n=1 Tax=Hymenobacter nitidus TaxID=2880929 RepID=A0ABS8AJX7_9BACT|nr:hypothetical protein [Hymenobacter nitidus]MCB2379284.1 hypothetical protein [Hymenobacter nitidus]
MNGPIGKKDQQRNTDKVQEVLDRLYTEGYHLVTSAGGSTTTGPVVTFVFRRD